MKLLLHETILLVLWITGPALILSLLAEVYLFKVKGVFTARRWGRAIAGFFLTILAVCVLGVAIWIMFPFLAPGDMIPDGKIPKLFPPSFIASFLVTPLVVLWVTRPCRKQ